LPLGSPFFWRPDDWIERLASHAAGFAGQPAQFVIVGGWNMTAIFRNPRRGHFGRASKPMAAGAGSRCEPSICGQVIRYAGLIRGVAFGKPSVAPMSGFAFSAAATTAGPGGSAGLMCYSTNHTCINAVLEGRMRAIRQRVAGVAEVRHPVTAGTGR
jgi:hypothetical protein